MEEDKTGNKNSGETKQERELRIFLMENGLAFEQHKRVLGDGEKLWIVDFYLPNQGIIIEAKTINYSHHNTKGTRVYGQHPLDQIYKDVYKMDELNKRYNLQGILYINAPNFLFGKTFIPNLNGHNIYCIREPNQILAIIQKQKVEKINAIFQTPKEPKPKTEYIFADETMKIIDAWAKGKTYRELGLHSMTLHRTLRKFVTRVLENEKLDAILQKSGKDSAAPQ